MRPKLDVTTTSHVGWISLQEILLPLHDSLNSSFDVTKRVIPKLLPASAVTAVAVNSRKGTFLAKGITAFISCPSNAPRKELRNLPDFTTFKICGFDNFILANVFLGRFEMYLSVIDSLCGNVYVGYMY